MNSRIADQATGLRRLFAARSQRLLPVAANPFVTGTGPVLGVIASALVSRGHEVLLVDAAETSPRPREWARLDLAAGIEPLGERLSYLAARGLPLARVDTRGSAARFVDEVCAAAPQADVVLLHADATDLARLLQQRAARPLLLGADRPDAIKHAYACTKLLVQRCELMTFDLVLAAHPSNRRVRAIAATVASCAERFLGALLLDWCAVDPLLDGEPAHDAALQRLLAAQLSLESAPMAGPPARPARRAGSSRPADPDRLEAGDGHEPFSEALPSGFAALHAARHAPI